MYELMLILDTGVTEENRKKLFAKIEKLVGTDGKVDSTSDLGKKNLAYKIKNKQEGHYWLLTISMSGKEAASLTGKLKMEESILRMLLVKKEE